jgi:hypothetical protein
MSDPNAAPIAGWYPDPENEAGDRWWNGATWSDHRRARNAGPGWAPSGAAPAGAAPAGATAASAAAAGAAAAPAAGAAPGIPVPPVPSAPGDRPNPYAGTAAPAATFTGTPVQPYAPPYAYNYAPRTPMANVPAFAGMITSLCALLFNFILFGLPGLVGGSISIYGLIKANKLIASGVTTGHGKGYAIVGIISGFAGALLWDLFYFAVFQPFTFS